MTAPHAVLKKFPPLLNVLGASPEEVGEIAGHEQLAVLGLAPRTRFLEEAFIALTGVQS